MALWGIVWGWFLITMSIRLVLSIFDCIACFHFERNHDRRTFQCGVLIPGIFIVNDKQRLNCVLYHTVHSTLLQTVRHHSSFEQKSVHSIFCLYCSVPWILHMIKTNRVFRFVQLRFYRNIQKDGTSTADLWYSIARFPLLSVTSPLIKHHHSHWMCYVKKLHLSQLYSCWMRALDPLQSPHEKLILLYQQIIIRHPKVRRYKGFTMRQQRNGGRHISPLFLPLLFLSTEDRFVDQQ